MANAADLDFFLVFILRSRAWHRGFSHSLAFALVVCLVFAGFLGRRHLRQAAAYGLAFASHGLLDYATTKEGGGVQLLWPVSADRLAGGLVGLSELPSRLAATQVIKSLLLEAALFAPLLVLLIAFRKRARKAARTTSDADG